MRLKDIYSKEKVGSKSRPVISFEVFPPKGENAKEKTEALFGELDVLKKYSPELISVTCGAGGSSEQNSTEIVKGLLKVPNIQPMPHFTCVMKSKEFVEKYLTEIKLLGVKNILALRGDIPSGCNFEAESDFHYACELVKFIKEKSDLSIGVAGYPEGHIECESFEKDIVNLKKKVDAGADAIFTQLFFDNNRFFNYCEKVREAGIDIPIVAGILPVTSYGQINKMLQLCRVTLPENLSEGLEKYKNSNSDIKKFGIEFAINQCRKLVKSGVSGLHFYCLNKSQPTGEIIENIFV